MSGLRPVVSLSCLRLLSFAILLFLIFSLGAESASAERRKGRGSSSASGAAADADNDAGAAAAASPAAAVGKVSYYAMLKVDSMASVTEIKRAYRRLALSAHPDGAASRGGAADDFMALTHAYDVLTDDTKRQRYNYLLQHGELEYDDARDYSSVDAALHGDSGPPRNATAEREAAERKAHREQEELVADQRALVISLSVAAVAAVLPCVALMLRRRGDATRRAAESQRAKEQIRTDQVALAELQQGQQRAKEEDKRVEDELREHNKRLQRERRLAEEAEAAAEEVQRKAKANASVQRSKVKAQAQGDDQSNGDGEGDSDAGTQDHAEDEDQADADNGADDYEGKRNRKPKSNKTWKCTLCSKSFKSEAQ